MKFDEFVNYMEISNDKAIICDVDDVLLFTVPFWYNLIIRSRNDFHPYINDKYLNLPNKYNYRNKDDFFSIMKRNTYDLTEALLKEEVKDKNIIDNVRKSILDLINTDKFYLSPNLIPNHNLIDSLNLILKKKSFGIEKLYLVTKSLSSNADGKIKLLQKLFINNLDKVEIVIVNVDENKSDFINTIPEDIVMIFDDDLKNLYDVILNCNNCKDINFMIPEYGFNSEIEEDMQNKAKLKGINILYYKTKLSNIY